MLSDFANGRRHGGDVFVFSNKTTVWFAVYKRLELFFSSFSSLPPPRINFFPLYCPDNVSLPFPYYTLEYFYIKPVLPSCNSNFIQHHDLFFFKPTPSGRKIFNIDVVLMRTSYVYRVSDALGFFFRQRCSIKTLTTYTYHYCIIFINAYKSSVNLIAIKRNEKIIIRSFMWDF